MSLPPADELSRWTVNQVNTWLSQNSLTAFRDAFLSDSIDGSKLMRMKPTDIDQRYHSIPPKKRSVLKEILSKLDTSPRPSATWNSTPPLPPRPKPPPSNPSPDESDEDDNGWSDSFETDDDSPGDYVEPTSAPSGAVSNSLNQNAPSKSGGMDELEVYEQVEEETQSYGLDRKTSLFCKLKTALNQRQQVKQDPSNSDSDGESYLEPVSGPPNETEGTPPPRPPKPLEKTNNTQSKGGGHMVKPTPVVGSTPLLPPGGHRPPPPRPSVEPKEPEDVYEVMEEAADNVNGEEEYMEPDAPSPPEIAVEKSKQARGKLPPEPAQARKSSREDPKKVVREEPSIPKSTSVLPPRQAKKISNTTPPSGGWLFNSAQATQGSSKKEDLSSYPWFHGNIKREDADHIFAREHMEGMFLIRKSERKADQPYTLVLWHHGRMWNLPVRLREDKKYAAGSKKADESAFDSIVELVEHFKIRTLNLKSGDAGRETTVTLRQAAPKH